MMMRPMLAMRGAAASSSSIATTASAARRGFAVSALRCNDASKSVPTPATTTASSSSSTGERNLPAEQKERQETAVDASIVSDAPVELHQRTVRIFRPAKTANSSGRAGTQHWRVNFDLLQGSDRWENPLMGWASTADYVHNLNLNFKTKEDAIHFVEKQGWNYYVVEPNRVKVTPKSYAANYAYIPTKLRVHHTK